jgi:hypothetical protein
MAQFKVLFRHLPEETEEKHEKPQSGWPVSGLRFESGTSPIRRWSANHSAAKKIQTFVHKAEFKTSSKLTVIVNKLV